jgi:hypothetical protein
VNDAESAKNRTLLSGLVARSRDTLDANQVEKEESLFYGHGLDCLKNLVELSLVTLLYVFIHFFGYPFLQHRVDVSNLKKADGTTITTGDVVVGGNGNSTVIGGQAPPPPQTPPRPSTGGNK